jgi:hypothetical protein
MVTFFKLIEPLGGSLVERIPRPIRVSASYPPRGNEMAEIVKEVKRHER